MNASTTGSLIALLCAAMSQAGAADINTCKDAKGHATLTDRPCNIARVAPPQGPGEVGNPSHHFEAKEIFRARNKIKNEGKPMPPEAAQPRQGRPLPDTF